MSNPSKGNELHINNVVFLEETGRNSYYPESMQNRAEKWEVSKKGTSEAKLGIIMYTYTL